MSVSAHVDSVLADECLITGQGSKLDPGGDREALGRIHDVSGDIRITTGDARQAESEWANNAGGPTGAAKQSGVIVIAG